MHIILHPLKSATLLQQLYEIIVLENSQKKGNKGQNFVAKQLLRDPDAKINYSQDKQPDIILSDPNYLIMFLGGDYFHKAVNLEVKTCQWGSTRIKGAIATYKSRGQYRSLFCGLCLIIFRTQQTNKFIKLNAIEISGVTVFMTPEAIQKNAPKQLLDDMTDELKKQFPDKEIETTPLGELKDAFNTALLELQGRAIAEANEQIMQMSSELIDMKSNMAEKLIDVQGELADLKTNVATILRILQENKQ